MAKAELLRPDSTGRRRPAGSYRVRNKPVYDKSAWAVNKTNLNVIIKDHGEDETKLVGKKIKLEVVSVRNPKIGEMVAVIPKKTKHVSLSRASGTFRTKPTPLGPSGGGGRYRIISPRAKYASPSFKRFSKVSC